MSGRSTEGSAGTLERDGSLRRAPTILIADRNPRIRGFVERELRDSGYRVFAVENISQLCAWITPERLPDLLVLDPDLPGGGPDAAIWPQLARFPHLPVVFHCLAADMPDPAPRMSRTLIVEKSADSIDMLKRQITLLLRNKQQD